MSPRAKAPWILSSTIQIALSLEGSVLSAYPLPLNKPWKIDLPVADRESYRVTPQCEAGLDFLYNTLLESVGHKKFLLMDYNSELRCLVFNGGSPSSQPRVSHSTTIIQKPLASLEQDIPPGQLHEGAVKPCLSQLFLANLSFFLRVSSALAFSVAQFSAWC